MMVIMMIKVIKPLSSWLRICAVCKLIIMDEEAPI